VRAHIDLAKAEFDEVKAEVGRASGLAGAAIASLILMSLLVAIGGMLFTGEWIFGSIGWGVLLGAEMLIAVALTLVLVALYVPGLGRDVALAVLPGIAVGLILGFAVPHKLFTAIGDASALAVDPAIRPLVVGVILVGLIGAVTGLVMGARYGRDQLVRAGLGGVPLGVARAAVQGLIAGALAGALFGAFLAISFTMRTGVALGIATFLAAWSGFMGLHVRRQGIDFEALKAHFIPQTTIDTTKESIEWAKARVQREPKS
jgi:hypothetical protein